MNRAVFLNLVGKELIDNDGTVFWIESKGIDFYEELVNRVGEEEIENYICS